MGPCFFDAPFFFTKANFKDVDRRIKELVDPEAFKYDLPDKQSFYLDMVSCWRVLNTPEMNSALD